jgi:DNA polymerase-3 subunit epsilon
MNYLVLDTETSGLMDFKKPADAAGQPRVCQVGLIFVDNDLVVEREIEHLIKPNGWTLDNEGEAAKINGLTQEKLEAEGVDIREVLREYGSAIDERRIVVGHNCSFDMKLMRAELRFAGFPDRFMQTRNICTMWGSRDIVGIPAANGKGFKIPKLSEACVFFGIEQPDSHSALADARSALQILRCLRTAGEFPAFKDPYDKGKPKPARRPQGKAYEEQVIREQQDLLGGTSEDSK